MDLMIINYYEHLIELEIIPKVKICHFSLKLAENSKNAEI